MNIIITQAGEAFVSQAASAIARYILEKPDTVLGLATGATTKAVYEKLAEWHQSLGIDLARVTTFNPDEYMGLAPSDPLSCAWRIHHSFVSRVNMKPENAHVPDGLAEPETACRSYQNAIGEAGGIDLMVLGIGENGHLAFNEPGAAFGLDIHTVPLSAATRESKAAFFGGLDNVPRHGITMGIKTIMRSRKILLLACGASKAGAVRNALRSPVCENLPASVLQLHPNLTVLLDEAAAG